MIVHTSAVMNKYSNINGKVEITTQLRLSECKRLYSAPLMGIKLNLSKATFGSLLLLSLISSSFDLFGQGALFSLTLSALPVH